MGIKRGCLAVVLIFLVIFSVFLVNAEAIGIDVKKIADDNFNFKLTLYDDNRVKIDGQLDYSIQNFHTEIVQEGKIDSGENINFKLPKNPVQGPWKITVKYNGIEFNELFNVGDVKRADIRLEKDNMIIENTGNIPYDKKILIHINNEIQTIQVYLSVGQLKKIKLTAPNGDYTIKVDDGEKQITQTGVSLTGNVIGMESIMEGGFWSKYPLVALFLLSLFLVFAVISILKVHNRITNRKLKTRKRKR